MDRRRLLMTAAALALAGPAVAAETDPGKFISQFAQTGIVDILEANIPNKEKQERFRVLFKDFFDIPAIARFVLGRHFRTLEPAEQERFLTLYEDVIVFTWSRRFSEYSGQTLRVDSSVPDGEEGSIVKSALVDRKNQSYAVDWRLRKRADGFKIVDIIIEGVSMAITYRQEYATILQQSGGKAGLLAQLQKQVDSLKAQSA